jgi:hypothetical protein
VVTRRGQADLSCTRLMEACISRRHRVEKVSPHTSQGIETGSHSSAATLRCGWLVSKIIFREQNTLLAESSGRWLTVSMQ